MRAWQYQKKLALLRSLRFSVYETWLPKKQKISNTRYPKKKIYEQFFTLEKFYHEFLRLTFGPFGCFGLIPIFQHVI